MNERRVPIIQRLYSINDTAEQLGGIGRTTVYALAKRGELELVKIGSRSFVTLDSIDNYLASLATNDC